MDKKRMNRIRTILSEKDINQKELAAMLKNVDFPTNINTISRWCNNLQQPNVKTLFLLAEVLDTDVRNFLVSTKKVKNGNI